MQILVLGAGATGGYFGGRLLQAGRDVTFLVRSRRAAELADAGLVIRSPFGDATLQNPATIAAENLDKTFDLILLSCKAYDLDDAITSIEPAVGPETTILPLLNGLRHLDVLDQRFGSARVFGGLCAIAATLDDQRAVVHLNELHSLTYGARNSADDGRLQRVTETLNDAGFAAIESERIEHDMWQKWVFLAALASATCLMRASVGDIMASPGGEKLALDLLQECREIAESAGFAPDQEFLQRARSMLTARDSTLTASMLRDIGANSRIEADHVIGDLIRRRTDRKGRTSLLDTALTHLKAYENGREKAALDST